MQKLNSYKAWVTTHPRPNDPTAIEVFLGSDEAAEAFAEYIDTGDYSDGDQLPVTVEAEDGTTTHWVVEICLSVDYTAYPDEEYEE